MRKRRCHIASSIRSATILRLRLISIFKMKGFLFLFAVVMAFLTLTSSVMAQDIETGPLMARFKRGDCDYWACDSFCRSLKFPGGACVKNKCDCDRF